MGFSLGSTKIRQRWTKEVERFVLESPLVRLMKDHDYRDVYEAGEEAYLRGTIDPRSVVVHRYYDQVSREFDPDPERPLIPDFARGLGKLIEAVRDSVCGTHAEDRLAFRAHLVAHSIEGLIYRCFLQNTELSSAETRGLVDKVFTYATPPMASTCGSWATFRPSSP